MSFGICRSETSPGFPRLLPDLTTDDGSFLPSSLFASLSCSPLLAPHPNTKAPHLTFAASSLTVHLRYSVQQCAPQVVFTGTTAVGFFPPSTTPSSSSTVLPCAPQCPSSAVRLYPLPPSPSPSPSFPPSSLSLSPWSCRTRLPTPTPTMTSSPTNRSQVVPCRRRRRRRRLRRH